MPETIGHITITAELGVVTYGSLEGIVARIREVAGLVAVLPPDIPVTLSMNGNKARAQMELEVQERPKEAASGPREPTPTTEPVGHEATPA